jgi:hypothetical protein
MALLLQTDGAEIAVEAQSAKEEVIAKSRVTLKNGESRVQLEIAGNATPGSALQGLAAALGSAGSIRIRDLAMKLADAEGSFGKLDLSQRQAAVQQLETAFLDPTGVLTSAAGPPTFAALKSAEGYKQYVAQVMAGSKQEQTIPALADLRSKLAAFQDLQSVDWRINTSDILGGSLGAAVVNLQNVFRTAPWNGTDHINVVDYNDYAGYRDYLVDTWFSASYTDDRDAAVALITARYHQDFTTVDTNPQTANEIVINSLRTALTSSSAAGHGFGVDPANIQARGARSAREYLDYLISLTHLSAAELGLRYRIDFARLDAGLSSPVQENISALLGLMRDDFQSPPEPAPLLRSERLGRAPFFLEYDEWLHTTALFYGENYYHPAQSPAIVITQERADHLKTLVPATDANFQRAGFDSWPWVLDVLTLPIGLKNGLDAYVTGEYTIAADHFRSLVQRTEALLTAAHLDPIPPEVTARLQRWAQHPVRSQRDLAAYVSDLWPNPWIYGYGVFDHDDMMVAATWRVLLSGDPDFRDLVRAALVRFAVLTLPVCLGDLALGAEDFAGAVYQYGRGTRFLVGRAQADAPGPYLHDSSSRPVLYHEGDLPYTVDLGTGDAAFYPDPRDPSVPGSMYVPDPPSGSISRQLPLNWIHPIEQAFLRISQADAMLEWADALYRCGTASQTARARELYKGVLWLLGDPPAISPHWAPNLTGFVPERENSVFTRQKNRARQGFYQIENGLNFHGYTNDHVPLLRYSVLKTSADRCAAAAKIAQSDYIGYVQQIEALALDRLRVFGVLNKANAQIQITREQAGISDDNLVLARQRVEDIRAEIAAKQQEINDHNSFGGEVADFLSGIVDFANNALHAFKDAKENYETAHSAYEALVRQPGAAAAGAGAGGGEGGGGTAGGVAGTASTGLTTTELGSITVVSGQGMGALAGVGGAAMLGGFAVVTAAAVSSLSGMADAANQRLQALDRLNTVEMAGARALLDANLRESTIAGLEAQIAQADAQLALDLLRFQTERFLNTTFWARIAGISRRILRRYLDLGSRSAWIAQRALSFEQDRDIQVIRSSYIQSLNRDIGGADLLALDLAELDSERLGATARTLPVRKTFSLARDFPLEFARLRAHGSCTFVINDDWIKLAYPGAYGSRVRKAAATPQILSGTAALRGFLKNNGSSLIRRQDGTSHAVYQSPQIMPLSDFDWDRDAGVFGLPDEALSPFEGLGTDSAWTIEFPSSANPMGRGALSDVLLMLDITILHSESLYRRDIASLPDHMNRFVLLSAAAMQPSGLANLRAGTRLAEITFDIRSARLPTSERSRVLNNLAVLVLADGTPDVRMTMRSTTHPATIAFTVSQGTTATNAPPLAGDGPASPLNVLVGGPMDTTYTVAVNPADNASVNLGSVLDVVLALDYTAQT